MLGTGGRRVGVLTLRRLESEPGRIVSHQRSEDRTQTEDLEVVEDIKDTIKGTQRAVATETDGTENPAGPVDGLIEQQHYPNYSWKTPLHVQCKAITRQQRAGKEATRVHLVFL